MQTCRMTSASSSKGNQHDISVLKSHSWRTAQNCAEYLIPHIKRGAHILDVGCGPGSITADFANLVGKTGQVIGVDAEISIVNVASKSYKQENLSFQVANIVSGLPFPDHSFDIVHAHQVVQYLAQPVSAFHEMRRVCRPGGIIAVRDADYHGMVWSPANPGLDLWMQKYQQAARHSGGDPNAGRSLLRHAKQCGFSNIQSGASVWCFAQPERRRWWAMWWANIVKSSKFSQRMRNLGTNTKEIENMSKAWLEWSSDDFAWFSVLHGHVLCFNN